MHTSSQEIPKLAMESWETLPQFPASSISEIASIRRRLHDLSCGLREEYEGAIKDIDNKKYAKALERSLRALRDAIVAIEAWHELNRSF